MDVESEYSESSSITFEWTLRGLNSLFDSTKGDKKSKVTKSIRFGNNRWQILFYPNAGQTKEAAEGGFVSLYLSCEPTPKEKELALSDSGRWVRDGVYKFSFELRNVGKTVLYNSKEAQNHSFTYKTANWGWAQFARRDNVYYQSLPVKAQDAFVIICTITSSPAIPKNQILPRQPVPKALLDTVGMLLDDPLYSDVQFVIPRRGQKGSNGRTIWASKRILQRADYFQTMFNSNFVEGYSEHADDNQTPRSATRDIRRSPPTASLILDEFEDSDTEDEGDLPANSPRQFSNSSRRIEEVSLLLADSNPAESDRMEIEGTQSSESCASTPPAQPLVLRPETQYRDQSTALPKIKIVVRDAAYTTYYAMLYYIYTDNIVFAPLSSSFIAMSREHTSSGTPIDIPSTPSEGGQMTGSRRVATHDSAHSRAEWIRDWMRNNPGRPSPCSAKSIYRIADMLDLSELKERAAQHIMKSLTVDNIGYEVFSPFAAAFEAIRKVEVEFFLSHWQDIRASETMKNVWLQIRNGRHPGFEEVWPVIAQRLEFKPATLSASTATRNSQYTG
ncbi:hypothetical protein M413DRAFT_444189 [Hebeloma cylindrosporum]|uniref:MATH domain-containing protein n=1 Tax=Hebeloma cylindrosporum TaxID=76867 RepID=A0A0C3CIC0_HEBCY|nr:hypothetical protein M413DRAFT_444189 [Hebeloma cylindrosporum h7]